VAPLGISPMGADEIFELFELSITTTYLDR